MTQEKLESSETLQEFIQAITEDLDGLARLHAMELDVELLTELKRIGFPESLGFQLLSPKGQEAILILKGSLESLSDPVASKEVDDLATDFAAIYLNYSYHASPNESVWVHEESLERQEAMFEIRSYYQRFGLKAGDWRQRSDDNLVLQILFIRHLLLQESNTALSDTAHFMDHHVLRWITLFAEQIASRCQTSFYAGLAILTAAYLEELRDVLTHLTGQERTVLEPLKKTANLIQGQSDPAASV